MPTKINSYRSGPCTPFGPPAFTTAHRYCPVSEPEQIIFLIGIFDQGESIERKVDREGR